MSFFQAEEFYVNVELLKAICGEYEITEAAASKPAGIIVRTMDAFDFDDHRLNVNFFLADEEERVPD